MSPHTTAYSLYAMAKFAKYTGGKGIDIQYTSAGKTVKIISTKAIAQRNLTVSGKGNKLTIKNNNKNTLFVRVINSGILPVGQEKVMSNNVVAKVTFKDRKGAIVIDC
jgi:maltoporin